MSVPSKAY